MATEITTFIAVIEYDNFVDASVHPDIRSAWEEVWEHLESRWRLLVDRTQPLPTVDELIDNAQDCLDSWYSTVGGSISVIETSLTIPDAA